MRVCKQQQIAQWFNTSVFGTSTVGTIGSGRRGQLRAPGDSNLDYSLFKNFQLGERKRLQFRSEFFNVLNYANLGSPGVPRASRPGPSDRGDQDVHNRVTRRTERLVETASGIRTILIGDSLRGAS
jgi:hypothetical protein